MKSWNHLNTYSHLSYKKEKKRYRSEYMKERFFSNKTFKYEFDITICDFVCIIYNPC
jgi:hypothetical protein